MPSDGTEDPLRDGYDRVAGEYARRIAGELAGKPLDRRLLGEFADRVRGRGTTCDVGCGPGHVTRYLAEQGLDVVGIDLSPAMVEQARRLNPGLEFRVGDLRALDVPDGAWAGITAFYSLIHLPRAELTGALRELLRVLQPGGELLVAFHVGDHVVHLDEWWGASVSIDTTFFQPAEVGRSLAAAGFELGATVERPPYDGVEYPSHRAYLTALRP